MRSEGASVHAIVAEEIGQRIVRGDYPPGTILPNEAKWAETFKVSRSAVREAVKMLTAKSLLASRPKIGSRVEPRARWNLLDREVLGWYAIAPAPDEGNFLRMIQEFRRMIEPEAAALAAMRASPEALRELALCAASMRKPVTPEEWVEIDIGFHLAVLAASGNDLLLPLGVIVETSLRQLFQAVQPSHTVTREVVEMHLAIERAIRLRRPEAARKAVRRLLDDTDEITAAETPPIEDRPAV